MRRPRMGMATSSQTENGYRGGLCLTMIPLEAATMLAEGGRRLAAGDYMYCVNIRNWVIIMSSMIGGHAREIAVSL